MSIEDRISRQVLQFLDFERSKFIEAHEFVLGWSIVDVIMIFSFVEVSKEGYSLKMVVWSLNTETRSIFTQRPVIIGIIYARELRTLCHQAHSIR